MENQHHTTRRGILAAMAVTVPVAAIAVPPAVAGTTKPIDTAEWDRALAKAMQADAVADRFHIDHYDPARAAYERELGEKPDTSVTYDGWRGRETVTADDHPERALRSHDRHFASGTYQPDEYDQRHRAALVQVIANEKAWEHRRSAIAAKHNLEALGEESDRLGTEACNAVDAAILTPAPHVAALAWKVGQMWQSVEQDGSHTDSWPNETARVVLADARRLAGEGR